jgi:hypothetical protein
MVLRRSILVSARSERLGGFVSLQFRDSEVPAHLPTTRRRLDRTERSAHSCSELIQRASRLAIARPVRECP